MLFYVTSPVEVCIIFVRLNKLASEVEEERQMNACLRRNQEEWQSKLRRSEVELAVVNETKDREIQELKDQVRDLMFFLESQAKIQESPLKGEIEGGQIVIGENGSGENSTNRKVSKGGRKSSKK